VALSSFAAGGNFLNPPLLAELIRSINALLTCSKEFFHLSLNDGILISKLQTRIRKMRIINMTNKCSKRIKNHTKTTITNVYKILI